MIDYTEIRRATETVLENNVTSLPIVFENTRTTAVNSPHIEVHDFDIESSPMDMSSSVLRISGNIVVDVFTKLGEGTQLAREVASEVVSILSDTTLTIEHVVYTNPEFTSVGELVGTNLYQHSVVFTYTYFYGQNDTNIC